MKTEETVKKRVNDEGIRHFSFLLNIPGTFGSPSTDGPSCLLKKRWLRSWKSSEIYEARADEDPRYDRTKVSKIPQRKSFNDFGRNFRRWTSGSGVDPKTPNPGLAASIRNNHFKSLQNKEPFTTFFDEHTGNKTASYEALRRIPDQNHHDKEKPPEGPQDPAITTEVAVPVEQVEDAVDAVIDEVQKVNSKADDGTRYDHDGFYYMAPLGVRFTASSEHMLTPEYQPSDRGSTASGWPDGFAMLELPFTVGEVDPNRAAWNPLDALLIPARLSNILPDRKLSQEEMVKMSKKALQPIEERLCEDFDGRPHMGKYHTRGRSDLEDMYDEFDTWYDVYTQFNAFGTFSNGFTDDLGISVNR